MHARQNKTRNEPSSLQVAEGAAQIGSAQPKEHDACLRTASSKHASLKFHQI